MDQELRAYLEDLKASIVKDVRTAVVEDLRTAVVEDLRTVVVEDVRTAVLEDLNALMDQRFSEQRRHTEILIEAVRGDVRLVAEGVAGVSERLETFQADTARRLEEVQASFVPYYRELDGRMVRLEDDVPALERRVTALETR